MSLTNQLPQPAAVAVVTPRTSRLAIWALVLGLLGLVLCLPAVGGLICGVLALVHIGKSKGALRGSALAVAGIVASLSSAILLSLLALFVAMPVMRCGVAWLEPTATESLANARKRFVTRLVRRVQAREPVAEPPPGTLQLVSYRSPVGELAAYLSPIPTDGGRHPGIIWLVGGFSNGIGDFAWQRGPADNDQSAIVFRQNGIVTLYPSLRGGNDSPGLNETFLGEVEDVLAAADFLASQPGVDPQRVYLGGHSTGGTLSLLVAESSARFRAVFVFGPVACALEYGENNMTFDPANRTENRLRSPVHWLHGIRSPTYVFEGTGSMANTWTFKQLARANRNALVRFHAIPDATHFSALAPVSQLIARQIIADTSVTPTFDFSALKDLR